MYTWKQKRNFPFMFVIFFFEFFHLFFYLFHFPLHVRPVNLERALNVERKN